MCNDIIKTNTPNHPSKLVFKKLRTTADFETGIDFVAIPAMASRDHSTLDICGLSKIGENGRIRPR